MSSQFEEVSRYVSSDLAYVVQIERREGRVVGREDPLVIALRVTLIFRLEDGVSRIVHRHADPITTPGPVSTTVQPVDAARASLDDIHDLLPEWWQVGPVTFAPCMCDGCEARRTAARCDGLQKSPERRTRSPP